VPEDEMQNGAYCTVAKKLSGSNAAGFSPQVFGHGGIGPIESAPMLFGMSLQ